MSTYCSTPDLPQPDGVARMLDVAYCCFGRGLRVILDGQVCYPTPDEARAIAAALVEAADDADESAAIYGPKETAQ